MINLLIGESRQPVKLYPGTEIQLEKKCDFFQLLSMNFVFGYDFIFPREGNEHIFYLAGDPDNTINRFNDQYVAELQLFNNTFLTGTFTLKESDDETSYRGTFDSISKEIYNNLDTTIANLLDEEDASLYDNQAEVNTINELSDKFVKFAALDSADNEEYNKYGSAENPYRVHFFHLITLMNKVCNSLGYQFIDLATENGDESQEIYLAGRRTFSGSNNLNQVCPDITVKNLFKTFCALTASDISINVHKRELVFQSIGRALDDPRYVDLSEVIYKEQTERWVKPTFAFAFEIDQEDDFYLEQSNVELSGRLLDPVNKISDLPGSPDVGDYLFVKQENAYWQYAYNEEAQQDQWQWYADPVQNRSVQGDNESDTVSINCPCVPFHKSRYQSQFINQSSYYFSNNGSNKLRVHIIFFFGMWSDFAVGDLVYLEGTDFEVWAEVTAYHSSAPAYFDLDITYKENVYAYDAADTYTSDDTIIWSDTTIWEAWRVESPTLVTEDPADTPAKFSKSTGTNRKTNATIRRKKKQDYYQLAIDEYPNTRITQAYIAKINSVLKHRIAFWNADVQHMTSANLSWHGTADRYNNRTVAVRDYALRWNGPDNIIDAGPWKKAIDYIKNQPRILRQYAWLNDAQIQQLTNTTIRKVKSEKAMNLIRRVRYMAKKGDKVLVEMEGYRL